MRFDNRPVSLLVSRRVQSTEDEDDTTGERRSRMRFPISESQHRMADGSWDVGQIVFDPPPAAVEEGSYPEESG
jgi:hypothetical protein